jgi:hypothetical protein
MNAELIIPETVGTLNLKIARLQQQLQVLRQQQLMSDAYPARKAELARECLELQLALRQLKQRQQEFLQRPLAA